jgi:hypothetical protein
MNHCFCDVFLEIIWQIRSYTTKRKKSCATPNSVLISFFDIRIHSYETDVSCILAIDAMKKIKANTCWFPQKGFFRSVFRYLCFVLFIKKKRRWEGIRKIQQHLNYDITETRTKNSDNTKFLNIKNTEVSLFMNLEIRLHLESIPF